MSTVCLPDYLLKIESLVGDISCLSNAALQLVCGLIRPCGACYRSYELFSLLVPPPPLWGLDSVFVYFMTIFLQFFLIFIWRGKRVVVCARRNLAGPPIGVPRNFLVKHRSNTG